MFVKKLRFFIIVIIVIGIIFRFTNIDNKVFWLDESFTTFKISGYTRAEWNELFNNQIIYAQELWTQISPNPKSTAFDTVKLLAAYDAKHTFLYFLLSRLWVDWLQDYSSTVIRSFSVILSLLTFPCLYWLCLELFQFSSLALLSVGLIAVSPFHILYAQEARPYSLMTATILFSSATLLRAIRSNTKLNWFFYTISLSLSIYTHTLSLFVFIAHGVYIGIIYGLQRSKILINYLIATVFGFISFMPWLYCIITNRDRLSASIRWHGRATISFFDLAAHWILNLSRIFVDFNSTNTLRFQLSQFSFLSLFFIIAIFIITIYSIYFLCRKTPPKTWLFILSLILIPAIALVIPDLLFGGTRSCYPRYLIASYLGIHLAITYLLHTKVTFFYSVNDILKQKIWRTITIAFLLSGVISCAFISPQKVWWNKYSTGKITQVAAIINQSTSPLVMIDNQWLSRGQSLSLSNFLKPNVKIQLLSKSEISKIPNDVTTVFIFNPSQKLQDNLKQNNLRVQKIHGNKRGLFGELKYALYELNSESLQFSRNY